MSGDRIEQAKTILRMLEVTYPEAVLDILGVEDRVEIQTRARAMVTIAERELENSADSNERLKCIHADIRRLLERIRPLT